MDQASVTLGCGGVSKCVCVCEGVSKEVLLLSPLL